MWGAAYMPSEKWIIAGRDKGHGSVNLLLHEAGHALDRALGTKSIRDKFTQVWEEAKSRLGDYYIQGNGAGQRESFAEAFGMLMTPYGHILVSKAFGDDTLKVMNDIIGDLT